MPSVGKRNLRVSGESAPRALDVAPPFHITSEINGTVRFHVGKHPIPALPGIAFQGLERAAGIRKRVSLVLQSDQIIKNFPSFREREGKGIILFIGVVELDGDALYRVLKERDQIRNLGSIHLIDGDVRENIRMV